MDNAQAGTGYQYGINSSFQDGHEGTPYRVASTNGNSMAEQSNMPSSFTPQSVLSIGGVTPSANGMSSEDYRDTVLQGGRRIPNANGQSQESFQAAKYMNFLGEFAR
jgi:hypothetical protein